MESIGHLLPVFILLVQPLQGENKCCVPDQFEAFFFYDNANCFIDDETAYSYINASVKAAYDWTNRRTYLRLTGAELTPLVPTAQPDDVTIINDFAKGIQYSFHENKCDKSGIDPMTRQCLPESAVKVSSSVLGDRQRTVDTYSYRVPSSPYTFTAVLESTACMAVQMTYTLGEGEGGGALNSLQISDVTLGIKDAGIFQPPAACVGELRAKMPSSQLAKTAKHLSTSLPFFI